MARRKARSGALPTKPFRMALSPPHASARIPSARQCAAPLPLSNVRSLARRVGKPRAQHRHTEEPCKLAHLVRPTSTALSDIDVLFDSKSRCPTLPLRCPTLTVRPLRLSQAGCHTVFRATCPTTTLCQLALTSCSPLRPSPSPWVRRKAFQTHTLLQRSTLGSLRPPSPALPALSEARRRAFSMSSTWHTTIKPWAACSATTTTSVPTLQVSAQSSASPRTS